MVSLGICVAVIVLFIVASVRSSRNYGEWLDGPSDLRRVGDEQPRGGTPQNGGDIWPGPP